MVDATLQAGLVDVDDEHDALVHGHGQRLRAAHAAAAAGEGEGSGEAGVGGDPLAARVARARCRELDGDGGEGFVGALQDALGADVDPAMPAVIWPYMVRPSASRRRNSGQFAQSPTRLELAMSTRGAHSWVRKTPTGLPDCTSRVSSLSRVSSVRTIAS